MPHVCGVTERCRIRFCSSLVKWSPSCCNFKILSVLQLTLKYWLSFVTHKIFWLLKVELAAVMDIGPCIVKATYYLEGDGPLSIRCYGEILKIKCAINAKYYPNLTAIWREACPGNPGLEQQLVEHRIKCAQPELNYFQENTQWLL